MNKSLLVSFIGIAVAGITFGLVGPVTVILLETHNTPAWITGAVTTMLYLSVTIFSTVTGRLIDKYSLKRVLSAGFIIIFICSLGLILWRNYFILFPVRFIMGAGTTFVFVGTEVLINTLSNETNRGKNISDYVVYFSIGIAIGTFLIWTVKIAEWIPFVIGSGIILIAYLFEAFHLEEVKLNSHEGGTVKFSIFAMPPAALLSAALYGIYESSLTVVIPLFGLRSGFSHNEVSYLLSSFVSGGIVLLYIIGRATDRISKYNMLLYISVTLALLLGMVMVTNNIYYLIFVFFLLGGIVPAFYTVGLAYTIEKVDSVHMAQANGHFSTAYGLGTLTGPIVGAMLIDFNVQYAFWTAAAANCVGFFIYFSLFYKEEK